VLLASFLGIGIGIVLGLTGAGGGILAIPALTLGLGWALPQAAPIALLAIGTAAALGAIDGLRKGLVRYRAALLMAALGLCFSPLGVRLAHHLPNRTLMLCFCAIMLFVALRMLLQSRPSTEQAYTIHSPLQKNCMLDPATGRLHWNGKCTATLSVIGSLSGLLTGMLGVGGGFLIVPALRQCSDIRMQGIVATSLMMVALISLGTAGGALYHGVTLSLQAELFIGATLIGMLAGRLLCKHLPAHLLQRSFALLCLGVCLYLFVTIF
jgi:uncharacterized membrane protein YfcA